MKAKTCRGDMSPTSAIFTVESHTKVFALRQRRRWAMSYNDYTCGKVTWHRISIVSQERNFIPGGINFSHIIPQLTQNPQNLFAL